KSGTKEGEYVTFEVARPQPIEFEGQLAIVNVGRDVTESKRLQSRLLLTDRMSSLGRLAAGAAHEINNPLAYLSANLEWLGEEVRRVGFPETSSRQELVQVVSEAQQGA